MTRRRREPLLAELHAHSRWSDGHYTITQLVDLYGSRGFDVLCITDHVVRTDDPWDDAPSWPNGPLTEATFPAYLQELEAEAARARDRYGLLLLPGLELSYNDLEPARAAHVVAVGLRRFVPVDDGIEAALDMAEKAGAALLAAHPFDNEPSTTPGRLTRRFACDEGLRARVHRFELFNRETLFGWVAREGLPAVATGDFHRLEHLSGWKTLLPCAQEPDAVIAYLRSPLPAYLVRVGAQRLRLAA
jgi:hypothetical protein